MRDVVWELAESVVATRYEDLSVDDVAATQRLILDTLATILAGSGERPFPELLAFYEHEGGRPEATVMVHGARLPARHAVVLNSGMARALDLDDVHEGAIVHTGVHVVPAALAVAERAGGINGKELIVAVAAAQDLMIRLSLACETPPILRGRPGTYIFGTFATAAVTARLLGLDPPLVVDALGNAYTRSAGTTLGYQEGALAQRVMQGLSAGAGVLAGLLAERGIGGIRNCLEGDAGYFPTHEGGRYDRSVLTTGLGRVFHGTETALKHSPVHRGAVLDLEVALAVTRAHAIDASRIDRVQVRYPARFASGYASIGAFAPERADPKGPVEPHFSSSWAVAVGLTQGHAAIDDFTEQGVARLRETVAPIAQRVTGVADPSLDGAGTGLGPRVIEVLLRDGETITARIDHAKGGPEDPFSWSDIVAKFRECAHRAARPLDPARLERVVAIAAALPDVPDVGAIPSMLV